MEEYNRLANIFENLDEVEKKACLIYKSKLSYLINEISAIPNFLELSSDQIYNLIVDKNQFDEIFNKYKLILENSKNLFIKMSIMNTLNFENKYELIDSLKNIYITLIATKEHFKTEQNLKLFRLVSTDKPINTISKGNIISTSIDINALDKFMVNKYNNLFQIDLEKDIPVLVIPYAILIDSRDNSLRIVKNDINQKEVIVFKDDLLLEEYNNKIIDDKLTIHKLKASLINSHKVK